MNNTHAEATQPAAAQEAVAVVSAETYSSDGTSDIIKPNLPIGTKLYAAPVAAAPVGMTRDDAEQAISRIMGECGFSMPSRAYADLVDELMSTPAAPGIDHAEMVKSNLRSIKSLARVLPISDVAAANIVCEAAHAIDLIDASPKGGINADAIREAFPLLDETGLDEKEHCCESAMQHDRKRLHAMLQATSAEVGA